jgi:hypothetical protein
MATRRVPFTLAWDDHVPIDISFVYEAVSPRKWEEAGWAPPAPQLPSLEVVLDGSVDECAQQVLYQHHMLAYGDRRQQLVDLCKLLGIEVI